MQLGEVLIELGLIDQSGLDKALEKQKSATAAEPTTPEKKTFLQKLSGNMSMFLAVAGILGITSIGSVAAKFGVPTIVEIETVVYEKCGKGLEEKYDDEYGKKIDACISNNKDLQIEILTCERELGKEIGR